MSNKHIFDYLDYYVDLPNPPYYAIMLTGSWGIGKSYNIKQYLKALETRHKKVAYVSLYGIKSSDEIAMAIITALALKPESKLSNWGPQLGRILLKALPMEGTGVRVADLIPDAWCNLFVLDDLERAVLSPTEILGFVNGFIENEGRRVVLIANEKELRDKDAYLRIREKVIGMTFELVEQSDEAMRSFIAFTQDEATRTFFNGCSEKILEIFAKSKTQNLRLLDQSLRCWERVYSVISQEFKKKNEGILAAFELFLALSLEVRAGRLSRENLNDRIGQAVHFTIRENKSGNSTPWSEAEERYGRICLHDNILTDAVLVQVLCEGKIVPGEINASLSVHPLFIAPNDEPNWRKVWHGVLRDTQEFAAAFEALEKEFAAGEFEDAEVLLHVFGLRLWGAQIGQLDRCERDVVAECKAYIDNLKRKGRLSRYHTKGFNDAALGLQFHNSNTAVFQELLTYYADQSELAYKETWQNVAQSLLADMSKDVKQFYRRICWSQGLSKPDYADDPVLSQIAPSSFVDTLLLCHPKDQRVILEGLKARYGAGKFRNRLAMEAEWILKVDEELQRRIPQQPPIRQYSLSNDTKRLLGPALQEAKETVACPLTRN